MSYKWIWCGKPTSLDKLHVNQLNSINKTLLNNKGTVWFNIPAVDWRKAINEELNKRKLNNIYKSSTKVLTQFKNYKSCVTKHLQQK